MILQWTPADGEPREFLFRPDDLLPAEYEPIELCGHWPALPEFIEACMASQRTAWRVALWVCLRREQPDLPLDEVQPRPLDLQLRWEPDEELALAEQNLADPDCPPALRELLTVNLDRIREAAGKGSGPAASPTSAGPASGTSRTTSGSGRTTSSRRAGSGGRSRGSTSTKG